MARGECLAHDAAVVYFYALISQGIQTLITLVEYRDCQLMTKLGTQICICDDLYLATVNNGCELTLYLCVKDLADVLCTEACVKALFTDTDTEHVTLTGMICALYTVQVRMELTLDNRLEIRLHALACYFYDVSKGVLGTNLKCINIRSDDFDLVILYFAHILGLYQLEAVHAGTVELYLHIFTTDDLTLECRCVSNRDINICDLDLDVSCLKRGSVELGNIRLYDQALRNLERILVCDYREAKCDCACTACYDYRIQRSKSVYECRYTLHGVLHQCACITSSYITKDQSCTDCNGYNMDNRCHILAKRDDTNVCTGLVSHLLTLIYDAANKSNENTLCLVALYKCNTLFCSRSCAKDNCNARDISGNKRNTKLTDHCVCQMAVARSFIRSSTVNVFQNFDKLSAKCGSNTGHKRIVELLLSCHKSLNHSECSL